MALPTTREETAAPGALAKSATFNAIQDCIVGKKHGLVTRYIGFSEIGESSGARAATYGPTVTSQYTVPSGDAAAWRFLATLGNPGDRIHEVRVICLVVSAVAGAFVCEWVKTVAAVGDAYPPFDGTFDSVEGPVSSPATANVVLAVTLTPAVPVLLAVDELHEMKIDCPIVAADRVLYRIEVDYDRP
jgi:hypothetical protein